jgi:hypothetical protein
MRINLCHQMPPRPAGGGDKGEGTRGEVYWLAALSISQSGPLYCVTLTS